MHRTLSGGIVALLVVLVASCGGGEPPPPPIRPLEASAERLYQDDLPLARSIVRVRFDGPVEPLTLRALHTAFRLTLPEGSPSRATRSARCPWRASRSSTRARSSLSCEASSPTARPCTSRLAPSRERTRRSPSRHDRVHRARRAAGRVASSPSAISPSWSPAHPRPRPPPTATRRLCAPPSRPTSTSAAPRPPSVTPP